MAAVPYTVTNFQNALHTLLDGDADYPVSGDDDWTLRLAIANFKYIEWATSDDQIKWRELWVSETSGGTVTVADTTYPCDAELVELGGYVKVANTDGSFTYWKVILPEQAQEYAFNSTQAVYLTGNVGAKVLNLVVAPVAGQVEIGGTITYPYYSTVTALGDSSTILMSDPTWLVDAVAAEIKLQDNDPLYAVYGARADKKYKAMKSRNEDVPNYFEDDLALGV